MASTRRSGWTGVAICLIAAGCASADDLAGVWRGAPVANEGSLQLVHKDQPVGVELVLGQYGPDVAGVVRWWSSADFLVERSADAPDVDCACGLVRSGKVSEAGDRASFWLGGCLPGAATASAVRTRVELNLQPDGEQLLATFTVDDETSELAGQKRAVLLTRTATSDEVVADQLRCDPPQSGGNGSSGL